MPYISPEVPPTNKPAVLSLSSGMRNNSVSPRNSYCAEKPFVVRSTSFQTGEPSLSTTHCFWTIESGVNVIVCWVSSTDSDPDPVVEVSLWAK